MIDDIYQNLTSALSELTNRFGSDAPALHLAVSVAFSSIFKKNGLPCIIVGGQSAAFWMRVPGSTDVDFVSSEIDKIAIVLTKCGFKKSADVSFRFIHPETNVLIELVSDTIDIAGMKSGGTVDVVPSDIEDPVVRSFLQAPAEVLDPVAVFVNYCNASCKNSIWFDAEDDGFLAFERAQALFKLYEGYILHGLKERKRTGEISGSLIQMLKEKFGVSLE